MLYGFLVMYSGSDIARSLGVTRAAVSWWKVNGLIPGPDCSGGRWSSRLASEIIRSRHRSRRFVRSERYRNALRILEAHDTGDYGDYGSFGDYVRGEYGVTPMTAYNWMRAVRDAQTIRCGV